MKSGLRDLMRANPNARFLKNFLSSLKREKNSPHHSLTIAIDSNSIECVLDVGANVGQFGVDLRLHGYTGKIISFEPVQQYFEKLDRNSKKDALWEARQLALGNRETKADIYISGNSGLSNSLLPMKNSHLDNFPNSKVIATETVEISTLDALLPTIGTAPSRCLLKIDAQGYEFNILRGAEKSLKDIPVCYLEVSLVQLYDGEASFLSILELLKDSNHELVNVFRGIESKSGQLLQLDILTNNKSCLQTS